MGAYLAETSEWGMAELERTQIKKAERGQRQIQKITEDSNVPGAFGWPKAWIQPSGVIIILNTLNAVTKAWNTEPNLNRHFNVI
jgi:hypothetical protein